MNELDAFLDEVRAEVMRAQRKFGTNLTLAALTEEVGELAKAMLDESDDAVRTEAAQVACMACRVAIEGDRSFDDRRRRIRGEDER